jgi:hypothetical protein
MMIKKHTTLYAVIISCSFTYYITTICNNYDYLITQNNFIKFINNFIFIDVMILVVLTKCCRTLTFYILYINTLYICMNYRKPLH